jgi:hypothetical protein
VQYENEGILFPMTHPDAVFCLLENRRPGMPWSAIVRAKGVGRAFTGDGTVKET